MLKIFLADLFYDTVRATCVVPLNIGYLAAFLLENYPQSLDVTLFKFPSDLEKALKRHPPDVLALSHYSWNTRLNRVFLRLAKRLNPLVVTVMGGPNLRTDPKSIESFLRNEPNLDYAVLHEGEQPLAALVGSLLEGNRLRRPQGCATIRNGEFGFQPLALGDMPKLGTLPSPYLSGLLDPFLSDSRMIPILESNRGCPYNCIYCVWGGMAVSRTVRKRPLDMVYDEIEYVAKNSVGQPNWMICDANFGILPRDLDIAKRVRGVADQRGFPLNVQIWQSKRQSQRNVEIAALLDSSAMGLVAMQSADPTVLSAMNRSNLSTADMKGQIQLYHDRNTDVRTDIMLGLPLETAESHLNTLRAAFDMGFVYMEIFNIRLLPGSVYETDDYRKKYGVRTKFRPIFGCYGEYDNQLVFECEESIRSTMHMSEAELNDFKVLHWLIYFTWNAGLFKPILIFGRKYGVNPADVLLRLSNTDNLFLRQLFDSMLKESMDEWFDSEEEMVSFFGMRSNFDKLKKDFGKLIYLFTARLYQDRPTIQALGEELVRIVKDELNWRNLDGGESQLDEVIQLSQHLVCADLLQEAFSFEAAYSGPAVAEVLNRPNLALRDKVLVEISRPAEWVTQCKFHLSPRRKDDLSLRNLARFMEFACGGTVMLTNRIRLLDQDVA